MCHDERHDYAESPFFEDVVAYAVWSGGSRLSNASEKSRVPI